MANGRNLHIERAFEDAVEDGFLAGGFVKIDASRFNAKTGLLDELVLDHIRTTQPKVWKHHQAIYKDDAARTLIKNLGAERNDKTTLGILRHGFKSAGRTVRLATFKPNSGMNATLMAAYRQNQFQICRQVHFDPDRKDASIDVMLAVNGLPVVTMELKNPATGTTIKDAKAQYRKRNPDAPLLRFKSGALVHFALDPFEAWMTTWIRRKETYFLPFNKGYEHGPGNPPVTRGHPTDYIWKDVLAPDSLLELIGRFLHLEEKVVVRRDGDKRAQEKREAIIFPRYHQRDCVKALTSHAREHGSGHNYLIQHSAGSGKSNSIAWLAYRLSSLHDQNDEKIFSSVIVISDRKVLDSQLQDTIYQFEHKRGVVEKIDRDSKQLARALAGNTPIMISTLQKFPFIMNALRQLLERGEGVKIDVAGKRFAVIVDEAHSSQTGEAARHLRGVLNKEGIEGAIAAQLDDFEDESLGEDAKINLLRELSSRPKQPNLSFFAFTATPKFRTLAVFNEPGPDGNPPFHLYSMKQAIEEGFILDVLQNFTTYKAYYGFIKKIIDDPRVPRREVAKKLARYAHLHEVNIAQKVEVIIEHFRTFVRHKLDGQAKAMVVTSSRLHAVRFKQAFDRYVQHQGYNDVRALVAFSGEVEDPDLPGSKFSETAMNEGLSERNLPGKFAGPDYQVLIVADKYQTGFDEPLLSAMYVDKVLSGVRVVQTLSRLNRTMTGKNDTFILDFANRPDDIFDAFRQFYEGLEAGEEPDPQRLYELQTSLLDGGIVHQEDIDACASIWFSKTEDLNAKNHAELHRILALAVERFAKAGEEAQEVCRATLMAFRNLYGFLSQIIPYQDTDLEKLYTYARLLLKALPSGRETPEYNIEDDVALRYYRLELINTQSINLSEGEPEPLRGPLEIGTGRSEDDEVELSEIINKLNDRFGTEFTGSDEVFFEQLERAAAEISDLVDAAKANSIENFELAFQRVFHAMLLERMEKNEGIATRLMRDRNFEAQVMGPMAKRVYRRILYGSEAAK